MNNSKFIFKINEYEEIIIQIDEYPEDVPYCFYDANFYLVKKNEKIKLCSFSLPSYIDKLITNLNDILQNKKQLPSCFLEDIGHAWNLYVNADNNSKLLYANQKYKFLDNYYLWYSSFTTWIYNDNQNNIILEVTPSYPYTYSSKFSYQNFSQWMKIYKPLCKTIIPRKTAEQWLAQATQILMTIDKNSEQLHAQGKL
ncbi:MAG: hypothetical protein WC755_09385 [Candidatus Woesearchaeota archaeon]|jgi:hypothetical protein